MEKNFIKPYKIGFVYKFQCIDKKTGKVKWEEIIENLMPDDAIDYFVEAGMNAGPQYSNWYIGLSETAYAPQSTDTMLSLITALGGSECQKYSGGARKALTADAIASGLYSNTGTPAEFDFTADATIRVGFVGASATWDETASLLISAVQFPSPRVLVNGDTLRVVAGVQLVAA